MKAGLSIFYIPRSDFKVFSVITGMSLASN
jgi:hypothetical protein